MATNKSVTKSLIIRLKAELENVLNGEVQPSAIKFEIRQINKWLLKSIKEPK